MLGTIVRLPDGRVRQSIRVLFIPNNVKQQYSPDICRIYTSRFLLGGFDGLLTAGGYICLVPPKNVHQWPLPLLVRGRSPTV